MSKPIRVLQIVTHMNRGGLETMLMNYYRNMDRNKVQFDFLTHRDGEKDYDKEILAMGGKIYHLSPLNPFSAGYRKKLDRFFAEHKEYRIVHSHLDCMSALPLHYAKKHGIPVRIAHSHNTSQEKNMKFPVKLVYKKRIIKEANILFACSRQAGKWMYGNVSYEVLPNAIDVRQFEFNERKRDEVRKKLGLEGKYVIGHVGRFNKQKNHRFLLKVFQSYILQNDKAVLLLAGTGELLEEIKELVKKSGISEQVVFLGNRQDVADLMQAMDVFVFPSLFEGLPVTLIEAQAAGLQCIVSENVTKEIDITGNVTFCSLEADAEVWCDKIRHARNAARKNENANISKMGYDIKSNAEKMQDYYLSL